MTKDVCKHLFVLAGGFGTRLKKISGQTPKPLVPVFGKPFIGYLIDEWFKTEISHYTFLLHYEATQIENYLKHKFKNPPAHVLHMNCINEISPMGTGGSVAHALERVAAEEFIIANADTWLPNGVKSLIKASTPSIGTVFVNDISRFGALVINNGVVNRFQEKTGILAAGNINGGIYKLSRDNFNSCATEKFDLENTILKKLAEKGKLKSVPITGNFIDIGIPEDFSRFRKLVQG